MQYSEIEKLIKGGKTSSEIRLIIKEFPMNPSVQYFMQLGYKESTAKKYRQMLKENDEKTEEQTFEFIVSKNANFQNIIVDTCAFGYKKTVQMIEEAKEVTVLLATIREMDTKKDIKKAIKTHTTYLAENIRLYSKKFLIEDKYRLVPFDGIKKDNYHDDVIIQYLMIMPITDRPAILTVDANLADKAKCYGLEYILYNPETFVLKNPKKVENNDKSFRMKQEQTLSDKGEETNQNRSLSKKETEPLDKKVKDKQIPQLSDETLKAQKTLQIYEEKKKTEKEKIVFNGVEVLMNGKKFRVRKYNGNAIIMRRVNGKYQEVIGESQTLKTVDIIIIAPTKKFSSIFINKIQIKDRNMVEEKKQYFYLNEIYIDDWIEEEVKDKIRKLF